jgi:hypothetical protein
LTDPIDRTAAALGLDPASGETPDGAPWRRFSLSPAALRAALERGDALAVVDGQAVAELPGHAERLGPDRAAAVTMPGVVHETRFVPPHVCRADTGLLADLDACADAGTPWGHAILPAPDATPASVAEHLRTWTVVHADEPEPVILRFADPRIIRPLLDVATPGDAAALRGDAIDAWLVPEPSGERVIVDAPHPDALAAATEPPVARDDAGRVIMRRDQCDALARARQPE